MFTLDRFGAEHRLVIVGMGDGPAHIRTTDVDQPILRIGCTVPGRGQCLVKLEKSLFGNGHEQFSLIREVAVRGRGADTGAACRLGYVKPFGPFSATRASAARVSARFRSPWW